MQVTGSLVINYWEGSACGLIWATIQASAWRDIVKSQHIGEGHLYLPVSIWETLERTAGVESTWQWPFFRASGKNASSLTVVSGRWGLSIWIYLWLSTVPHWSCTEGVEVISGHCKTRHCVMVSGELHARADFDPSCSGKNHQYILYKIWVGPSQCFCRGLGWKWNMNCPATATVI